MRTCFPGVKGLSQVGALGQVSLADRQKEEASPSPDGRRGRRASSARKLTCGCDLKCYLLQFSQV